MSWEKWPFSPRSLTDAIPEATAQIAPFVSGQELVKYIISGCSERIGRALTIIEPGGHDSLGSGSIEPLRRIDPVNSRQNFAHFCETFRRKPQTDCLCRRQDEKKAREVFSRALTGNTAVECYPCHLGLRDYAGPLMLASRPVAVMLGGQFLPERPSPTVTGAAEHTLRRTYPEMENHEIASWLSDLVFAATNSDCHADYCARFASNSVDAEDPFLHAFQTVAREIQRLTFGLWNAEKRTREQVFLDDIADLCYSTSAKSRTDVRERTSSILNNVLDFCSLDYLLVFASDAEKISVKQNFSLLPLFAVASRNSAADLFAGVQHLNCRKARLNPSKDEVSIDPHGRDRQVKVSQIILAGTERPPLFGIKGPAASSLSDAIALVHFYLSERYRGAFLFGPSSTLASDQLRVESSFFIEIGRLVGGWLLNQLDGVDSEVLSRNWSNVAMLVMHRFRSGLTPVLDSIKVIDKHLAQDPKYSSEDAVEAVESLYAATQFLDMHANLPVEAYAAAAESTFKFVCVDFCRLVSECVRAYETAAKKKSISIQTYLDAAQLGEVFVDPAQYTLALGYLIDNAIKYSHSHKEILVSALREEDTVTLCVDNFGLGIERDEDELIYERQRQGRRSDRAQGAPGEGWGLFHARLIARAHGGDVRHTCRTGDRDAVRSKLLEGYRVRFFLTTSLKVGRDGREDSVPRR